jgi:hypothetical protein
MCGFLQVTDLEGHEVGTGNAHRSLLYMSGH